MWFQSFGGARVYSVCTGAGERPSAPDVPRGEDVVPRSPSGEERKRAAARRTGEMFERFTERARRVGDLAQEEARLRHHNYTGTEHTLLSLIHEAARAAAKAHAALNTPLQ